MVTSSSTGAQGVAEVIATLEKPYVFGMPGGEMIQVFDALRDHRDTVETVLVREESIATRIAEAHGRLAGRPAVVLAQGAWILGVGGIGIMEAQLGSSPVVLLLDASEGGSYSHHGTYQDGIGGYGAVDLAAAVRAIGKQVFVATDPVQAVQMTQLAIKHAQDGEPGPVAVVFDSRAVHGTFGDDVRRVHIDRSYASPVPVASEESVQTAADAIRGAGAPIIIAGSGARGEAAVAALAAFASTLDIPVATTPGGKSVFPETSDIAAGTISSFGHDSANDLVGSSDLIIAIGTKLGATDTMEETPRLIDVNRQRIIQLDVESLNIRWTFPADYPLLGTVADTLPRLQDALAGYRGNGAERVAEVRSSVNYFGPIDTSKDEPNTVNPRSLARWLGQWLPARSIVTCDAGENRIFVLHDLQTREGDIVLQPNGGGGMGYAVPAALAATYTHPDQLAVAVLGDGGYAMSLHALMTAVENKRRLLVVVMDNQALGWVLHGQGDRPMASEFASFDLAKIAEGIGCATFTVTDEPGVRAGIEHAAASDGVTVLIVKTNLSESFRTIKTKMAISGHEEVRA